MSYLNYLQFVSLDLLLAWAQVVFTLTSFIVSKIQLLLHMLNFRTSSNCVETENFSLLDQDIYNMSHVELVFLNHSHLIILDAWASCSLGLLSYCNLKIDSSKALSGLILLHKHWLLGYTSTLHLVEWTMLKIMALGATSVYLFQVCLLFSCRLFFFPLAPKDAFLGDWLSCSSDLNHTITEEYTCWPTI